nr:unnamed protein product [Callosobruchus analis]
MLRTGIRWSKCYVGCVWRITNLNKRACSKCRLCSLCCARFKLGFERCCETCA